MRYAPTHLHDLPADQRKVADLFLREGEERRPSHSAALAMELGVALPVPLSLRWAARLAAAGALVLRDDSTSSLTPGPINYRRSL